MHEVQQQFVWLQPKDQSPSNWIFFETKRGRLKKSEACSQISCSVCGKFDELEALQSLESLPISVNTKSDYTLTNDGIIVVSNRMRSIIEEHFPNSLKFLQDRRMSRALDMPKHAYFLLSIPCRTWMPIAFSQLTFLLNDCVFEHSGYLVPID